MLINLLPVVNAEGKELFISESVDLSDKSEFGVKFSKPVKICAVFSNIAGSLGFSGHIRAEVSFMCDRCGEWFDTVLNVEFSELLKKELDQKTDGDRNPDVIFYTGVVVDIAPIIYNNVYMNFPSKKLCKEDCKGLCSVCGGNLNEKDCGCGAKVTDPRFDVLDKFFDK